MVNVNIDSLISQVKSIELELAILKARLQELSTTPKPKSFADLRGLWAGSDTSEEEIEAVEYRFDWDGKEER